MDTKQQKPLIYYYMLAMLVVMLLNALFFPALGQQRITEVSYDQFLTMVDEGRVTEVAMTSDQLQFIGLNDEGTEAVYKTGVWPDDGLTVRLDEAGVVFATEIPTQNSPLLSFIMTWIFPILMFVVIGQLAMRWMSKRMGGGMNAMNIGKSNAKIYAENETGVTFADVAGQEEAKEALTEIVDFLHNPEKYGQIGAKLPKGALLVGPPGTGKTLLARAVAGEAKVPFFSISGSDFVELFVGAGAAKVRDLFKEASAKAPCIVFIDEIDTIGKKRDSGMMGGNDEREQTLNQLLSEMDGFDGTKGVVILGATNRPEILDKALLRPGRFDRRVPVELPDLRGREAILKVHTRNVIMEDNIDLNAIARSTPGASGAELANIINEAALRAVRLGRQIVAQEDLQESVEVVIAGYQRKGKVLSDKEKEIVAYHEIGHALVAAMQTHSAPVQKITIIPRTSGALGYIMQVDEDEKFLMSQEEAFNKIVTATGGRVAEELVFDSVTTGASNDIEQATKIARAMITRYGMSEQFGMVALETVNNPYLSGDSSLSCSAETATRIDAEVIKLISAAQAKAREILQQNLDKLHDLSRYLQEKETITGEQFMHILNDGVVSA